MSASGKKYLTNAVGLLERKVSDYVEAVQCRPKELILSPALLTELQLDCQSVFTSRRDVNWSMSDGIALTHLMGMKLTVSVNMPVFCVVFLCERISPVCVALGVPDSEVQYGLKKKSIPKTKEASGIKRRKSRWGKFLKTK